MKHLKSFEKPYKKINEESYIKSDGEDFNIISEKDGSIIAKLEYDEDEFLVMTPLSTWKKFTIEELTEILGHMKMLIQTNKYNI